MPCTPPDLYRKFPVNTHECGSDKEQLAADYLAGHGYRIIARNFRTHFGEIDLIATDQEYLVFIEVKYRKNARVQHPAAAVDFRKQRRICQSAMIYMQKSRFGTDMPVRFDVIAILGDTICLYKNAFDYVV